MSAADPTLRELLSTQGVSDADIASADADGTALLLAVERLVFSDEPRYTIDEILDRTPIDPQRTAELWRSLGFPDPPEDEPFFTDADVQILGVLADLVERGASDPDLLMGMTRVAGQSMARFAAAQVELYLDREAGLDEAASNGVLDDPQLGRAVADVLPTIPHLLDYVWRRHMQAAARARILRSDPGSPAEDMAIGFADLVGFTALSQQLSPHDLAAVVDRFEWHAYDTVARLGGRVVKMIGDEVMFAADDPRQAIEIALELSEVYRNDDELSEVRVGVSSGPVLEREGDCFGPVVNMASRVVNIAYPGTVVVSAELEARYGEDPSLSWKSLKRKNLKDIGKVTLWSVRRHSDPVDQPSRDEARDARSARVEQEVERLTTDKAATREERAARREAEKQAKREAAARAKVERDRREAERRAAREAERAAEKAARDAERAAEKAERDAEKTAERAERDAEKAAAQARRDDAERS